MAESEPAVPSGSSSRTRVSRYFAGLRSIPGHHPPEVEIRIGLTGPEIWPGDERSEPDSAFDLGSLGFGGLPALPYLRL
jgi:hypothetical protein